MYHKVPKETWFDKGIKAVEGGLKIYGTVRGLNEAGSALATGLRSAYQVASPMLAMI